MDIDVDNISLFFRKTFSLKKIDIIPCVYWIKLIFVNLIFFDNFPSF